MAMDANLLPRQLVTNGVGTSVTNLALAATMLMSMNREALGGATLAKCIGLEA